VFVLGKPFQPSLMFAVKAVKHLSGARVGNLSLSFRFAFIFWITLVKRLKNLGIATITLLIFFRQNASETYGFTGLGF